MALNTKEDVYSWICSAELNPLGAAMTAVSLIARSDADPDKRALYIDQPNLSLSIAGEGNVYIGVDSKVLEKKTQVDNKVIYVMSRLGYSEEQARTLLRQCYAFEKKIACTVDIVPKNNEADRTYTFQDLIRQANGYPLEQYFASRGYTIPETAVTDIVYIRALDGLCSDAAGFRAMAAVRYIIELGSYLDYETFEVFTENSDEAVRKAVSQKTSMEELTEYLLYKV